MDQIKVNGVFDARKVTEPVVVIGCGALGSAVALQLAKLGLDLVLVDSDVIEAHNIPNQLLYGPSDIGKLKVEAAADAIRRLTDVDVKCLASRIDDVGPSIRNRYVMSAVDSMASRYQILNRLNPISSGLYIDGRMGARDGDVLAFNRVDHGHRICYEQTLFPDSEANVERAACGTVLSIGATASLIAAYMTWSFIEGIMERDTFRNVINVSVQPHFVRSYAWESVR